MIKQGITTLQGLKILMIFIVYICLLSERRGERKLYHHKI